MKLSKILITTISLFVLNLNNAFAIDTPGWVGPANIEYITVQPNGNIYIKLITGTPDLGCTGNADGILQLDTAAPNIKEQFSLLTAAHMANRQVSIYVNLCGYYPYAQNTRLL